MSGADSPAPFRIAFDNARDPYTARNALGITGTGGSGGGAPTDAQYITAASDPDLTNEMVLTDTATVTWDFTTPGQAKANASAGGGGGGNVSSSGTPVLGQYAKWVTSTTIQGVSPATVLSDIGAQPAGSYLTTAAAAATYVLKAGDTMTGPLVMPSTGTASATSINFGTASGGIYGTSNTISFSTGSSQRLTIGNAEIASTVRISAPAGSNLVASYHFGTSNTGFYGSAAPDIRATVGGANKLILNATNLTMTVPVVLPANPTSNLEAATKQYVDGLVGAGGTPGGATTQVQFNDAGAFGGDADLTWNKTTNVLTLTGQLAINLGAATSILAAGVVEASSFKGTGTTGVFAPATAPGNIALRPNGVASTGNQLLISTTSVTTNNPVLLPADPTTALQAATKQYVDTKAPLAAEYITSTADATLTAERVLTDTATVTWDRTTAGQIKANATGGGGSGGLLAVQRFTASGTYTPTAGMVNCIIECVAGGGGSGGSGPGVASQCYSGGGGGAGGYSRHMATAAAIGASQAVTVGTGGTAGASGGVTIAGAGTDTSVGALCIAKGGSGGAGAQHATQMTRGGAGGVAGTGNALTCAGAPGGNGIYGSAASAITAGGVGGSSFFGGGAQGPITYSSSVAGNAGGNYGGGAAGACAANITSQQAGAAGGAGIVIITEYK